MAPSIGPVKARHLIEKLGSAREVFKLTGNELQGIEGIGPVKSRSFENPSLITQARQEMEFASKHRIRIISFEDPVFPRLLNQCPDAPILIYTRGEHGLQCKKSLSVVGTRRATSYGRDMCRQIIMDLSQRIKDLVIVSGLAYGIDVIAHKAALDAGIPTVAVLGHGFSTIYPSAHRHVARKIIDSGALVTDFHSKTGPERNNFLRRNRIIAGMSNATLVVESASEGGALITANLTNSYGRDVLAVPGRTTDIRSRGCNELIKDCKAALVESAEDVLYHLNWDPDQTEPAPIPAPKNSPAKEELQLLQLMVHEPGIKPETLSSRSGIPVQQVLSMLVRMELNKWIMVEPGRRYHCLIATF
jgi:DNA processing protein